MITIIDTQNGRCAQTHRIKVWGSGMVKATLKQNVMIAKLKKFNPRTQVCIVTDVTLYRRDEL